MSATDGLSAGRADRVQSLDLIRGVAVLGIVAINIAGFAGPAASTLSPHFPQAGTPADEIAFAASFLLIEGKMLAYVYDAEFHDSVRVTETNFLLQARFDGRSETLSFNRSPNPTTGKVPEKSALFDARADWLKTIKTFKGTLPALTLGGQSFTNVTFSFPKGTAHSH